MESTKKKSIKLGNVEIGGNAPVSVQSMTTTDTRDAEATIRQIQRLTKRGCEICRVAVPDKQAVSALAKIVSQSTIPIIADIHFDWRLALASMEAGCAGIRINPGNIGARNKIETIAEAAKQNNTVIRIGVNSGSVENHLLTKYGGPTPQAMAESAIEACRIFESKSFYNLKLSLKSSSVTDSLEAYRLINKMCDYPLHIGITEAGGLLRGAIKSAIGLGLLLNEGIGNTLRVSLTAPPEEEITAAYEILRALGLRNYGPEIISCPTCGRTEIDLFGLAAEVEKMVNDCPESLKIAVMGCPVNGPGEAREADIGIAGGKNKGIIFRKGKIIRSVEGQEALLNAFKLELQNLLEN